MIWGRRRQTVPNYPLVLDIGTSYVKAVVFEVVDNRVRVISRGQHKQESGSMRGGMIVDLPSVVATCRRTIDKILDHDEFTCSSVILGVNGQLVEGITTTVHYDRAHPDQALEHSELKNIIYKIQQRAYDKLRNNLSEKFLDDHPDIELIHAAVVDVQLDGYTVEDPVGFQGKRLTLTIFNAYVPLVYVGILQNLAKELNLDIASIAALPYGVSKIFASPDVEVEAKSGVFVDIGGQTTDVTIVRNGSLEGMQSFALGGEAFTLALKRGLGKSLDKAEKIKIDYAGGLLDKRSSQKVADLLATEVGIWLTGVELALKELVGSRVFPKKIYLTGGSAPLPELRRALLTKQWTQQLPFTKKPYPALIQSSDLWGVEEAAQADFPSQHVPPLALTKLALNLISEDDVVTSTLQSIIRSMKED